MIGNVASKDAEFMAAAASSPGARNTRYEIPPRAAALSSSTYDPRPRPIAARNRVGVTNDVKMVERNVRRYVIRRCSKTCDRPEPDGWPGAGGVRVMAAIGRRYSISERPVSRRKTSSSDDRRTRTVSGLRPIAWTATAASSPSSA